MVCCPTAKPGRGPASWQAARSLLCQQKTPWRQAVVEATPLEGACKVGDETYTQGYVWVAVPQHSDRPSGGDSRSVAACPIGTASPAPWTTVDLPAGVNGVLYVLRTGCAGHSLLPDFPPWQTVSPYFRRRQQDGPGERVHAARQPTTLDTAVKRPFSYFLDHRGADRTLGRVVKLGLCGYTAGAHTVGRNLA